MQTPLILEVSKVGEDWTAGWPFHLCSSCGLEGLGGLCKPMLALVSWTRSSGKKESKGRASCQRTQVSRASKLCPIRILAGLLMAPPIHTTLPLKRAPGCLTEGGEVWGLGVPVALPSREPCKE